MPEGPDIASVNADLAAMMAERLGVSGRALAVSTRRAGRALPRWVRRDLAFLDQQETLAAHPKLRAFVDAAGAGRAARRVAAHLETIDPAERRKDRILGILAVIAFNVLLLAGIAVTVLAWRGVIGPG
jgi:hypothetical protein